jgi:hypothetical protein
LSQSEYRECPLEICLPSCQHNSGYMSVHDNVDVRGHGRRTQRGGTDAFVRPRGVQDWSISNLGATQEPVGRCQILRSQGGIASGQFNGFRAILIDSGYQLELPLSYCKQKTKQFLIVAESRNRFQSCSRVTGPNVAARTGADSLRVRIKYDESGRTVDKSDRVFAPGAADIEIHDQTNSAKGCGS